MLKNYEICSFNACGGEEVIVTTLENSVTGASCSGDTYLRLIDIDNDLLGYNDDAIWDEQCSEIMFSLPNDYSCQEYITHIGCFGSKSYCEAQVVVNITGLFVMFYLLYC